MSVKKEGKIRFSSFGTHSQDTLESLTGKAKIGELFDVLQVRFNFLECGPAEKIIPYAKAHNMGIVVIKPFRKGTLLNKSFTGSTAPTYTDARPPTDPIFANLKYKDL